MSEQEMDVREIVRGLDPIDWVQMKLLANLPPEKRVVLAMRAQSSVMSTFKVTLKQKYPDLSESELNMKVLEHFTTVRMPNG